MELRNPNNLYTGGAVVFERDPNEGQYLHHALQKKIAKDEALNQYFNDLPNKINTAGVRMNDLDGPMGGINKDIEKWKQNWMANSGEIRKGGMAQQQHMAQFQEILRKIELSKQRAKFQLDLGKARYEGKYDPDDDDINVLDKVGKSLYDPDSYKQDGVSEYGWGDLSPSVPAFDAAKQNTFWTTAIRGLKAGRQYDYKNPYRDPITGKVFLPFKDSFSPEQVKRISSEAADLVKGDRSAMKYYKKILDNPQSSGWQKLNEAYKSVYGKDAMVTTPEQAAAADAIIRASIPVEEGKEKITDSDLAFDRRLAAMSFNSGLIAGRGGGKGGDASQIDLTEYKKEGDGYNITDLMQGVKVTGLPSGTSLLAEKVVYNPKTKQVTYKEYTSRDDDGKLLGGQTKTVSLTKFLQDVKSMNPGTDMKFLDGLWNPKLPSAGTTTTPPTIKKEIKRSDIPAKAKAAGGYSVEEYIKILEKNGVTIKD